MAPLLDDPYVSTQSTGPKAERMHNKKPNIYSCFRDIAL